MKRILPLFFLFFIHLFHLAAQNRSPELATGLTEVHDLFNATSTQEISCYRIPALVTAVNGDLVAAIDERVPSCQDLRGSRDINIVIRRSQDHGKTWTEIQRIVDFPDGKSASDPSMIVDHITGEIFLFYNFMDLDKEKDIYYLHVVKSADQGLTWSEPEDITSQIAKEKWHKDFKFITSGRGIQTSTGKLLHCMVNLDHGLHLFASDDHGLSWHLIDTPIKPANESKVVELANGSWMVNSRVNKKGKRYVHVSSDQGQSWESRPEPALEDPGCNGSIIRYTSIEEGYKKNRLLFCNANSAKGRNNLTVRLSYDEGKTWTSGKAIYPESAAYSSLTVMENGDIGLLFEKDFYSENLFVSFSLDWLTDGKDQLERLPLEASPHDLVFDNLNGTWKFSMTPPEKYWENHIDFSNWSDIRVPGECQMQGFAIQHDRPYVYKRKFKVPEDFEGQEVYLNFYGVYSYARVWVNGEFVREHYGGFTKWTCPITHLVTAGDTAILTLEMVDRADDISYGSGYAKHQIGGILRDVELEARPEQHFKQLYVETDLDEEYKDAQLKVFYELQKNTPALIQLELYDSSMELVQRLEKETNAIDGLISMAVEEPAKWDAEHPRLYTLVCTLFADGMESLIISKRIGFREVSVEGNKLLVNGRPVKLRGACRHDIHPTLGRMTTPEYDLKDVLLAKESNMNFIRTSHYPPSEAFLNYCDEYGIYVEDETAVCFVGSHRTDAYKATGATQEDEEFTGRYLSQLEEMVRNHRNHPSVIIWSIGNENIFGKNFTLSYQWVKDHDNTRPIIYSYPGQVPDSLKNYEILSMHYPSWQGNLGQYGIETKGFEYEAIPALFDEWAHVACYNNFELKEDPNVRSFWAQSLDSMWTYTFEADGALGGAIWCMLDETFMLPEDLPGFNQWWGILDKNVIPATYMGPCVGYGEWGIVDTWRRKKPEFWGTKKAYSPARLLIKEIDTFKPNEALAIPVHNRFDHTNFKELKITWQHAGQRGELEKYSLEPHQKGTLVIPAQEWIEGEKLHIGFYSSDTLLVDQYALNMGQKESLLPLCSPGSLEVNEEEEKVHIKGSSYELDINKQNGLLENVIIGEDTLIRSGPYINLRVPGKAHQYSTISMDVLAKEWTCKELRYKVKNGVLTLKSKGNYHRLKAEFTIKMDEKGLLDISYTIDPPKVDKNIQEAGLKFFTGTTMVKLSWDREAYFTVYPETHPGRPTGKVDLRSRPEMSYRQKPQHGWEKDSWGFYYFGLEEDLPYTNDARSLKENIYEYALYTGSHSGMKVLSEGSQACRFDQVNGENILIINDSWDYNSLLWGNYMKLLPLEKIMKSRVRIALTE